MAFTIKFPSLLIKQCQKEYFVFLPTLLHINIDSVLDQTKRK